MAKKSFDDKWAVSTGDNAVATTHFNLPGAGIQAEFEERMLAPVTWPGVISGLAPSISTTNIAIASGDGYASGIRYAGGETIAFSGSDASGTYYVYFDASAEALAKSTSAPDRTVDLEFCTVAWNGSTTLSSLTDLRPYGVNPKLLAVWFGPTTTTTGIKWMAPVPWDAWIDFVQIAQVYNGLLSSVIVDVHAGAGGSAPTTIFTTTANRPSVAGTTAAYTVVTSGVPNTRTLSVGDVLTIEVDQAGGDATGLGVTIYGRLR